MFGWAWHEVEEDFADNVWWDEQVTAAVEESREIDLTIFHDFLETEVVHFQSLEQEWRVLPPTMVTRPRSIL